MFPSAIIMFAIVPSHRPSDPILFATAATFVYPSMALLALGYVASSSENSRREAAFSSVAPCQAVVSGNSVCVFSCNEAAPQTFHAVRCTGNG